MNKVINPHKEYIEDSIEMCKSDIASIRHCLKRNVKENKRLNAELSEANAKVQALQNQLTNLK